jgi:uncharacterized protein YvpB
MEPRRQKLLAMLLILLAAGCTPVQAAPKALLKPPRVIVSTMTPSAVPTITVGLVQTYMPAITLAPPTITPVPPTATRIPSITPTATPSYPEEYFIRGISGHKQYFKLGCEASVAKDWAWYFGVDLNEFEFQYKMPLSDNPDKGFVGEVTSPWGQVPPYGYGVHAGPVAALLREYGLPAKGVKGMTQAELRKELSQGKPVIAWVIGNVVGGIPYEYTDKVGDKVTVAAYEHVVIVTGYNKDSFRYNTNGRYYDVKDEYFLNSFKVLGNMALIYDGEYPPAKSE